MSSKIVASTITGWAVGAAMLLVQGSVALAQTSSSDSAIAQSLFDEGRKLMGEKKYTEACPRLERSYQLDAATGTLLNMAVCHEAVGKTATAWNEFRDALSLARRENKNERVEFAQEHIDGLKDRLCTLTVKQAGQEPGLEWKIDGAKVGSEALGIALPIDRGSHTVEAVAPGKQAWKTTIEIVADGEAKSIEIPALAVMPVESGHTVDKSRGPSPWIFVAAGVGVLGFGAMAVGGIESLSSWSDRKAACGIGGDPNACTQAGIDADKQARTWAIVADVGLGVGIAGTVVAVVIAVVTRGKPKEAHPHVSFAPLLTARSAGVGLGGAF